VLRTSLRSRSAKNARGLVGSVPSNGPRAQGRPDAGCTRGNAHKNNHRFNRSDPAFPARVVYGVWRALLGVPGIGQGNRR
jgi:hypothetical protein